MNAIEIKNLSKIYKGFKLNGLDLTLPSGCIMGLVGENGAGKSTTIKLIMDLIHPDSGKITVLGCDHRKMNKEDVGVVLDDVGLPAAMNARQIGRMMAGIFHRWEPDTYNACLRRFDLPDNRQFRDFSKGMKMKLGLAVALSHGASLLILDEATSGLDPVVRDELLDLLNEFTRNEDHSVLISSHIVSDLEKICDYIAFLHKGKLMLCQEKDALLEQYAIVRGSAERIGSIDSDAVIGRKDGRFGVEAIVRREAVPEGVMSGQVTIEELFVFMAKEEK